MQDSEVVEHPALLAGGVACSVLVAYVRASLLAYSSTGGIADPSNEQIVSLVAYRLLLHPLAKYPGPLAGRLTDWYSVYHTARGDNHVNLYELHLAYGPIVRYGPNRVSFNSATALRDIYGAYGTKARLIKADYYTVVGHHFGTMNLVSMDDPAEHARKRRIMAQALTTTAVKGMEDLILKNARLFCEMLGGCGRRGSSAAGSLGGWSPAIDFSEASNCFTFDVMADNVFGENLGMLTEETNRWFLRVLPEAVKFLHIVGHMPGLLKLDVLPLKTQMAKDMETWQRLSEDLAQKRIEREQDTRAKDVFSHLLDAKDPETGKGGLSVPELVSEAGVLMVAGSDTTALAITSTIFYLARNPDALARLGKELAVFPDVEAIRPGPLLLNCTYLRACLDEAMRLTPAVGGLLPRTILEGGATVDGQTFPQGTRVGVAGYAIHHNPDYFPSPFAYRPERWIVDDEKKAGVSADDVRRAQNAFFQFSTGPRGCLGKTLAYVEMTVAVARIIWTFDVQLVERDKSAAGRAGLIDLMRARDECPTLDKFVSHPERLLMKFKLRQ